MESTVHCFERITWKSPSNVTEKSSVTLAAEGLPLHKSRISEYE